MSTTKRQWKPNKVSKQLESKASSMQKTFEQRLNRYKSKQLDLCGQLLTKVGVPEWVCVDRMPGNSTPLRLQWYLARRKDVSPSEVAIDGTDADIRRTMRKMGYCV